MSQQVAQGHVQHTQWQWLIGGPNQRRSCTQMTISTGQIRITSIIETFPLSTQQQSQFLAPKDTQELTSRSAYLNYTPACTDAVTKTDNICWKE